MSFLSNVAGAFGISTTGILSGALKVAGVPSKAAEAIGLAAELARGVSKDGFDFGKVNKGALARHALQAFGVSSPAATLGLTLASSAVPNGFLAGASTLGAAGLTGAAVGTSAMSGLVNMQSGILSLLGGIAGVGGINPTDIAGTGMKLALGNNTAQVRQMTGMTRSNLGPGSMLASLPKPAMFEDIVMAFMIDVVKDKQDQVESDLKDLEAKDNASNSGNDPAGSVTGAVAPDASQSAQDGNSDSRNIQFEIIKNEMQKLSQMQQAMDNVLNSMNDEAMNAIRHIKGS